MATKMMPMDVRQRAKNLVVATALSRMEKPVTTAMSTTMMDVPTHAYGPAVEMVVFGGEWKPAMTAIKTMRIPVVTTAHFLSAEMALSNSVKNATTEMESIRMHVHHCAKRRVAAMVLYIGASRPAMMGISPIRTVALTLVRSTAVVMALFTLGSRPVMMATIQTMMGA